MPQNFNSVSIYGQQLLIVMNIYMYMYTLCKLHVRTCIYTTLRGHHRNAVCAHVHRARSVTVGEESIGQQTPSIHAQSTLIDELDLQL